MSRRAATTCWGIALIFAAAQLAFAEPRDDTGSAAAAVRPYEVAWTAVIDAAGPEPVSLVADQTRLVVVYPHGPVVGRDAHDGGVLWTWNADAVPVTAPVAGDGLVFITTATWIYALDMQSGRVAWRVLTPLISVPPVAVPGWLVVASGSELSAYRTAGGTRVWSQAFGSSPVTAIAIDGPRVFAPLADRRMVAMGLATGAIDWQISLDVMPGMVLAANDRLYFGGDDGNFYCYSQEFGRFDWGSPERVGVIDRPVTDGTRVYFAGFDNSVRARDARSGNLRWRFESLSRPFGALYVESGHLVIPSVSGEFYLCLLADGRPAGVLSPVKATADEGIRLDAAATSDQQLLFRVTASSGSRTLTAYRPGGPKVTPVVSVPGKPMALREPGAPRAPR